MLISCIFTFQSTINFTVAHFISHFTLFHGSASRIRRKAMRDL